MQEKNILIADGGSTKTDWCLLHAGKKKSVTTQGMSPYFLNGTQMQEIIEKELLPALPKKIMVEEIFFYGTGCASPANAGIINKALKAKFPVAKIAVAHDLLGAARALCLHAKGVACILGTGSGSCYYDGKKIAKINPGLGYILGDEGSGAYLGKKVLQYYLYNTFDEDLKISFQKKFNATKQEILDNVYKEPLANRYLASFSPFLYENRGHFMIENIIEDGLNEFFFAHICKYSESWKMPINFVGSIAWLYQDVLKEIAQLYELQIGKIIRRPMEGLIEYHAPASVPARMRSGGRTGTGGPKVE